MEDGVALLIWLRMTLDQELLDAAAEGAEGASRLEPAERGTLPFPCIRPMGNPSLHLRSHPSGGSVNKTW